MGRRMIDLRSDTVTKPTPAMRQAMFEAEVGDDVYGEDPTANRLEQRAAEVAGKEAALFVPTGTMGNTIAIKLLTEHGQEVVCDSRAHLLDWELSMLAWFSGCLIRSAETEDGILTWDHIRKVLKAGGPHSAPTGAIALENTHNMAGGRVYPQETIDDICDRARLSKALGAPAGSIVAGPARLIERGRLLRKRLGGGMRQVGVLAAAGLVALEESPKCLHVDHANAQFLAKRLACIDGITVRPVETNIVVFDLPARCSPRAAAAALKERGVLLNAVNDQFMRAVTHYDVSREDCAEAIDVLAEVIG
jgi:threonine aldolase